MAFIVNPGLQQYTMSALTVKNCIDYLKYVLTELIPIAKYTDMHVMVDKISLKIKF